MGRPPLTFAAAVLSSAHVMYSTVPTLLYQPVPHCTVLYCTIPHQPVPHCTVLYCTVLYHPYLTNPYRIVLHCTALYWTILYHTAPYRTILHYTVLRCSSLAQALHLRSWVCRPIHRRHHCNLLYSHTPVQLIWVMATCQGYGRGSLGGVYRISRQPKEATILSTWIRE